MTTAQPLAFDFYQTPNLIGVIGAFGFEMAPELKKIFQGLSWSARMQLLAKYYPDPHPTNWSMEALMHTRSRSGRRFERIPSIEALRHSKDPSIPRRQFAMPEEQDPSQNKFLQQDDDNDMVMKLFRLMYETIRDSDLKVKRAELIKAHYVNSSAFEVGYLLGEVTEKYNIMTDIAATLKRLYAEWKPIEHINAYEQIANHGVEISHLIDIIRTSHRETGKKEKVEKGKAEPEKIETEKNTNVAEGERETQQSKKEAERQRMFVFAGLVIVRASDYMSSNDKWQIMWYAQELVEDITRKVHQVDGLFEMYGEHFLFEVGFILGQIREKHKLQMEYFRQFKNKFHHKAQMLSPEMDPLKPVHYFVGMEHIHRLELDIDHLVESLLRIPSYVLDSYQNNAEEELFTIPSNVTRKRRTTTRQGMMSIDSRTVAKPIATPNRSMLFRTPRVAPERGFGRAPGLNFKISRTQEDAFKRNNRVQYMFRHGKRNFSSF